MTKTTLHDELSRLGLSGVGWVDTVLLPPPDDDEELGAGLRDVLLAAAMFWSTSVPLAEQAGFELECGQDCASHVRVSADSELALRTGNEPGPGSVHWSRGEERKVVSLDLRALGSAAMTLQNGDTLVLVHGDDGITVGLHRDPAGTDLFGGGDSPLLPWMQGIDDPWMQGEIAAIHEADPWGHLRTVARFARLVEAPSDKAAFDRLMRGEPEPALLAPREWAQSWTPRQREWVEDLVLGDVDDLIERLDRLEAEDDPADEGWRVRLAHVLRARDDLQGICLLLAQGGDNSLPVQAVSALDAKGERFAFALGGEPVLEDRQLQRARNLEMAQQWWTRFSQAGAT